MEITEKIFGSSARPRILRAFVANPTHVFDPITLAKKIKVKFENVKKEISSFEKVGLLKRRVIRNEQGRKVNGFIVNPNFIHFDAIRDFLFRVSPLTDDVIAKKIASIGRVKLVIIAGIFINDPDSRVDMLVVADKPSEKKLKKVFDDIESEFGREIVYTLLSTEDFKYRHSMGDKLMRDVFDFGHIVILDKMGFTE